MTSVNEETLDHAHYKRREQIKKAALKVFAARGIIGTKMSMIAEEAGISQGLSYRYFKSKEELFTILIQEALEEANTSMAKVNLLPGTPKEQIRMLTKTILDESNKLSFMLIQQAKTSDGVPEKAKEIIKQYSSIDPIETLVPIFVKGQRMGEFCEGEPYRLLFFYFSVITGLMLQDIQIEEKYGANDIDLLIKLLAK